MLSFAATKAWAGAANYQPYVIGERASGMGGAVVATADGMDASYYNPAGLGYEKRDSISVNGTVYGVQNHQANDAIFPGDDFDVSSFVAIPAGLSAVKKLKEGTVAAFSVFIPSMSSSREIKVFEPQNHYYNYSQDEQTLLVGPSIGHIVNDRLSIGASVYGVYQTASEFLSVYLADYDYLYTANYTFSVLGVIGTVGARYRIAEAWSVGLAITTPSATLSSDGRFQVGEVQGSDEAVSASSSYDEGLDADNGLPARLRMGIGWHRPEAGGVGFDVTHYFARDYDWLRGKQDGERVAIQRSRKAVTDLQLGGEYIIRKRYPLRAGFFTSFSSASDVDVTDLNAQSQIDLYGVTASVGSVGENVVLNVGVSYVWGNGDTLGRRFDEEGCLVPAVADVHENSLYTFVSTAYRF